MIVMFITVGLMTLVMIFIWHTNLAVALLFLFFFGLIEAVYLSSTLVKIPQGAWIPLIPSFIFMFIMYVWHYGTRRKYLYDLQNKVSMKWILGLGPSLGIVRIPGIGLIYTELVTGVPSIFSHFVTNVPAFHQVLVFVCVKSSLIPHVPQDERYLIGRIGPRNYHMFRCIVRYGYKDIKKDEENFEDQLVLCIAKFIEMEAEDLGSASLCSYSTENEGRMALISTNELLVNTIMMEEEDETLGEEISIQLGRTSQSDTVQSLQSVHEQETSSISRQHRVCFELSPHLANSIDPEA
jgi:KUP system potassium uptake protein